MLFGDSAARADQIPGAHPNLGAISMQTGKPQTELPKDLTEGLWYRYPGKENYYVLQTPVLPAKTTVDIAVKVTQGKVKVFGGPNDEPHKRFEQEHTVFEGSKKKMRFTTYNAGSIYIRIERVTQEAICQVKYTRAGTIIPFASNTISVFF